MEPGTDIVLRRAARVLLVDAAGRVLLMRGRDPARPADPFWLTPGGGIEPGETPAEAATRELYEETGLRVPADRLGAPVSGGTVEFGFDGRQYRQEQEFFLCRVDSWQPVPARFDAVEHATIDAFRWWSAEELEATDEQYYPVELPDELRRLLAERPAAGHARGGGA